MQLHSYIFILLNCLSNTMSPAIDLWHIFNYMAELGTSRARKQIVPMEHWKKVTERHGLTGRVSTAASSLHITPHPLSGTRCQCTGLAPHHSHSLMVPLTPQSEQGNVPVDPT